VNGIINDVVRVDGVFEVAGDLLHGKTSPLLVLPQAHVHLVGEGKAKEDGCKEHLDGDEEVLVGGGSDSAQQVEPLQDGQDEACRQREEIERMKERIYFIGTFAIGDVAIKTVTIGTVMWLGASVYKCA